MEFKNVIEQRTSIRKFSSDEVAIDDLKEMVRRAGLAPSMNNQQPWKFIAIKNKDLLIEMATAVSKKISEIPSNESSMSKIIKSQVELFATFFKDAPAVIVLAMHPYETFLEKGSTFSHEEIRQIRNYPDMQCAGAAIENLLLTAVDLGYGGCWMSTPLTARNELEDILKIEEPYKLISFVAIGKPVSDKAPSNKKPLNEILEIRD